MSVDDRIRSGLAANAAHLPEPDVEALLSTTFTQYRRRRALRWAGLTGLAAAACAAVVVALVLHEDHTAPPLPARTTTTQTLVGRYAGLVDAPRSMPQASGRWVLAFDNGKMTVTPPPGYTGTLTGTQGTLTGRTLQTSLFSRDLCAGQPPGKYTLETRDEGATITLLGDQCGVRGEILTSASWVSTAVATYTGPRIPDGRWTRDVTVADMHARGFYPDAETLASNGMADGKGRSVLEFRATHWVLYVETAPGKLEIGDQGDVTYDALGRWVQNGVLAVQWSVAGDTLTTYNVVDINGSVPAVAGPDESFALGGTWKRVP
jgi:hypothetical protein